MEVICINTNYLNNVNGKVPGRTWTVGDPEIDKVYNVISSENDEGVEYLTLEGCHPMWAYEATSFERLVADEVLEMELGEIIEVTI